MKKAKVVLNEQHTLMEDQVKLLNEKFGLDGWEIYPVPSSGWTLSQMKEIIEKDRLYNFDVVFSSPVPYMLGSLAVRASVSGRRVYVFHNDRREKKELPHGKVIHVVARTGWELVEIV